MSKLKKTKKKKFDDRTYPDVMVDLETLSTETDAVVLSIGAVRFRLDTRDDVETIKDPDRSFYARLDTASQEDEGRDIDPDTIEWWESQSAEARQVFEEEPEDPVRALKRFVKFCTGATAIWGNGNMFDNAIVRSLCDTYNVEYPLDVDDQYGFTKDLDMRTLKKLWNKIKNVGSNKRAPKIDLGTAHNALDDARMQVLQCQIMFDELRGSKYDG